MKEWTKVTKIVFFFLLFIFFEQIAIAAPVVNPGDLLPASTNPSVMGQAIQSQNAPAPQAPSQASATQTQETKKSTLGPQAEKIKFKLTKVILEGNTVYSEKQLLPLYKNKLNKTISIAEFEQIVQDITNYYRNNGYILSRAILPPQRVVNGVIHIRIIEGYIAHVKVQGTPKRAKYLLEQIGKQIIKSKPLKINAMEHYLRLANEIPGLQVRAVLEPSKTEIGASDLNLVAQEQTINAYFSYDNYGTLYIGPNQLTGSVNGNSVFQSGDTTNLTMVRTTRPQELKYVDFSHQIPMGGNGWRSTIGVNNSATRPEYFLRPLKISGDATNFYGLINYPYIRSRNKDITFTGGLNYIDSATFFLPRNVVLYNDHIRSAKIGGNMNFSDRFYGTNFTTLFLEHGFPLFGASTNPNSRQVSRFGADGVYTKWNLTAGRVQYLYKQFSAFFYASGQYSYNPLLATAQFAFGGPQLGRAYDPGEIIGDRGAGGSVEVRMDRAPGWKFLQTYQPFIFYDAGVIWNLRNVPGVKQKQSATSTGGGIRFNFMKNVTGQLMLAQPLTKQIASYELKGDGRRPRGYFSITASF